MRLFTSISPTVPGFTNPKVLGMLYSLVIEQKPERCLEIGTFMGRSSTVISSAMVTFDHPVEMVCVDLFDVEITEEYLSYPLVRQVMEYAEDAAPLYKDLSQIKTIEDSFDLTISRFPYMKNIITKRKSDSYASWEVPGEKFQFVYIDGDHSYEAVRNDFLKALPLLSDGAVVVFDDYSDQFPGVIKFVDELTQIDTVEIIDKEHPDVAIRVHSPGKIDSNGL